VVHSFAGSIVVRPKLNIPGGAALLGLKSMIILIYIVLVTTAASIFLTYANNRWGSPVVAIGNRWLRWFLFAALIGLVTHEILDVNRPFWVLAAIGFLLWFLGETLFNWLAIKALSQSQIPLFPRFSDTSDVQEWPVQKRSLAIRDWLRAQGFTLVQSLKSDLGMGIVIRTFVFQSQDNRNRAQVIFIPQRSGNITECLSIQSITESGIRLVTDNLYIPFGGFYPDNWRVMRKAWLRDLARLWRVHEKRCAKVSLQEWEEAPLEDLNYQQSVLERVNTELGFLYPRHLRDEYGKITTEGRYRVWKEVWILNYFGRSCSG
jgi:hypothetical protein